MGPNIPTPPVVSPLCKSTISVCKDGPKSQIKIHLDSLIPSSPPSSLSDDRQLLSHHKSTPGVPDHPMHNLSRGVSASIPNQFSMRVCDHYKLASLSRKAYLVAERICSTRFPALSLELLNVIHMHNIARTFTCYTHAQSILDISPSSHLFISLDGGGGSRISDSETGPTTWAFAVFS